MSAGLSPVIAATTQWLLSAYPATGGAMDAALAHAQARQAVTVAAWLRHPSAVDVELLELLGPGGSARLDGLTGAHEEAAWRSWVDEVVASWAASLLADGRLAAEASAAAAGSDHAAGLACEFRRLTAPDDRDRAAAALLRHPDLTATVAGLHHAELLHRLADDPIGAA
jgi:hypothetical protein